MTNISARTWLLMGFGLSLLSVVTNIFVLASINDRVRETDAEISKLTESLRTQAIDVNRADLKFDLFTILNHVSKLGGDEEVKKAAGEDSILFLQDFLGIYYSAVNEVPANEMLRAESEQAAALIPIMEKMREAEKLAKIGNEAEAEKLMQEAQLMYAGYEPKSELGRKLQDAIKVTETEGIEQMTTDEIAAEITPHIKSSIEQYVGNYQKKEERIKQLQNKKANLAWWANLATYVAVSLQLLGLMFVLTKDLASDLKERREKAETEIRIAETEARQATAEAREAKAEADEYVRKAEDAREDAEDARKQADEAEDVLAELKEEIRLCVDDADETGNRNKV